jgi:hypothetical protein
MKKKAENQKAPTPSEQECLELLIELITAFQKIPQRYCLFCKAKANLSIEAHRPGCPLRRAFNLLKAAQK